jgi:hypothetical protein
LKSQNFTHTKSRRAYRFYYHSYFPGANQYADLEWTGNMMAMPYGFAMCTPDSLSPQYEVDCANPPHDFRVALTASRNDFICANSETLITIAIGDMSIEQSSSREKARGNGSLVGYCRRNEKT